MTPLMLLDSSPRTNDTFLKAKAKPVEQIFRYDRRVSDDPLIFFTETLRLGVG